METGGEGVAGQAVGGDAPGVRTEVPNPNEGAAFSGARLRGGVGTEVPDPKDGGRFTKAQPRASTGAQGMKEVRK